MKTFEKELLKKINRLPSEVVRARRKDISIFPPRTNARTSGAISKRNFRRT